MNTVAYRLTETAITISNTHAALDYIATELAAMKHIEKEIARLGFNKQAQSYRSPGNFKWEKVG